MNINDRIADWRLALNQAQVFAEREIPREALVRAQKVVRDIESYLAQAKQDEQHTVTEFLTWARNDVAQHAEQLANWNTAIRKRTVQYLENTRIVSPQNPESS